MKILALVGSPRKRGNTDTLVDAAITGASLLGAEVEKVYIRDLQFEGCIGCEGCSKSCVCVIKDDMQRIYKKLDESEGLILGSPTYFYNVTWLTKKFLDRLYAYEIFSPHDRSVWTNYNEVHGLKYALTIAVCEQENEHDMGFTSETMSMTLQAAGWRSIENLKILHVFEKGAVDTLSEILKQAERAGKKLARTIELYTSEKNMKAN